MDKKALIAMSGGVDPSAALKGEHKGKTREKARQPLILQGLMGFLVNFLTKCPPGGRLVLRGDGKEGRLFSRPSPKIFSFSTPAR